MLLFAVALMTAPTPAVAVATPDDSRKPFANAPSCPRTTKYYAWRRGEPLKPKKLTELPPATTYMAVVRQIGGCDAPLTEIEYRGGNRR